ncbi:hypothetical protein DFH09DRAFT_1282721 [Mycena vulgaris]|nr:hypothetical protein DFH09DRAFT_1282721 [Mycena vulgaris]
MFPPWKPQTPPGTSIDICGGRGSELIRAPPYCHGPRGAVTRRSSREERFPERPPAQYDARHSLSPSLSLQAKARPTKGKAGTRHSYQTSLPAGSQRGHRVADGTRIGPLSRHRVGGGIGVWVCEGRLWEEEKEEMCDKQREQDFESKLKKARTRYECRWVEWEGYRHSLQEKMGGEGKERMFQTRVSAAEILGNTRTNKQRAGFKLASQKTPEMKNFFSKLKAPNPSQLPASVSNPLPSTTTTLPSEAEDLEEAAFNSIEDRDLAQTRLEQAQMTYDECADTVNKHIDALAHVADNLRATILAEKGSISNAKKRERQGERDIRRAVNAVTELEASIEAEIGAGAMEQWQSSLGKGTRAKPSLPAAMDGVAGSPLKAYIQGPRTGEAGSSRRVGGAGDIVPEACEIGGGGM